MLLPETPTTINQKPFRFIVDVAVELDTPHKHDDYVERLEGDCVSRRDRLAVPEIEVVRDGLRYL